MSLLALGLSGALLVPFLGQDRAPRQRDGGPDLVLEHLAVFDGTGDALRADTTIALDGDRIVAVVASSDAPAWPDATHLDLTGRFAIPGLFDLHVHPDDPELWELDPGEEERLDLMRLFVLAGVTSVRDMGGDLARLRRWQGEIESGRQLGPRIFLAGPLIDGPQPMWPGSKAVDGPETARRVVDELVAERVDFLKVYSLLSRESFLAIAAAAKEHGIPFAGHVPFRMGVLETAEAGMRSQEHLLNVLDETVDADRLAAWQAEHPVPEGDRRAQYRWRVRGQLAAASDERVDALARRLAALGTAQVPTMVMWHRQAWFDPEDPRVAPFLPLLPRYLRDWWDPAKNIHLRDQSAEDVALAQAVFRRNQAILRRMHAAGVPILPGTDTGGNPLLPMGFALHDELAELVAIGMSPAEVLRAATSEAAALLGHGDDLGVLRAGALADLVILDADPLADIRNTTRIRMVVARGAVLDRARIEEALPLPRR